MGINLNNIPKEMREKIHDNETREIFDGDIQELEIHSLPPMLNEMLRMHWAVKSKKKREWKDRISLLKLKRHEGKVNIHMTRFSTNVFDADNLTASFKFILDSLVSLGVLEDDNMTIVTKLSIDWKKVNHRKDQRIRVQIINV